MKKKWLKLSGYGAVWLTAATLLTKLIGVMQKIPLQNLAGDSVFGIYNIVYPIYQMMIALAIAGIPTALAVYIATQEREEQEETLSVALSLSVCAALVISWLGFASASWLGAIIGHEDVISSLRVLSVALLITPIIAVYRGYYQGIDQAHISSISQLLEQLVRVACMVMLLWMGLSFNWSDEVMAAAVMWGSVVGAIITLIWFIYRSKTNMMNVFKHEWYRWRLEVVKLLKLALPTALAAVVVPMVAVVDAFTVPRLLIGDSSVVMAQFGQYSRIQPFIQLVSMFLAVLAAGFLPRWLKQQAEEPSRGELNLSNRLLTMHRIALIVCCGAAAGLYILAEPINLMLYKDSAGLLTFRLLALTAVSSSLLAIQAPLLQGAGIMRLSIWLVLLSAGSKAVLNLQLIPKYGIQGAAISANIALTLSAAVGLLALFMATYKGSGMHWRKLLARELLMPSLAIIGGLVAMLAALQLINTLLWAELTTRLQVTGYVLVTVCIGALTYGGVTWILRAVRKQELQQLL